MSHAPRFAAQTAVLSGFWVLLSGRYDALFLGMGLASALGVTALTHDLLAEAFGDGRAAWRTLPRRAWYATVYAGWLLARIVVSSTQVAYLVLHPRMPLDPAIVRLRTGLRSPMARTILANTITLIPGTMTVAVDRGELTVHVLNRRAAEDLASRRMQDLVGRLFGEEPERPPELRWEAP